MAKGRNKDETIIKIANEADDFGALFRTYLVQRTENLLAEVSKDDTLLDEEVRSKALAALEFALESSEMQSLAGGLLLAMAPKMERAGFRNEWMVYLKRWLSDNAGKSDLARKGEVEYQAGFLSQLCSDFEQAKEYLKRSHDTFEELSIPGKQARALNRLAFVVRLQDRPVEARNYVEKAITLLDLDSLEREFCHFILAVLAEDSGNYTEAVAHYRISLDLCKQIGDSSKLALRLGNLGLGLYYAKEYAESIDCYQQSISLFTELNDKARTAGSLLNLGVVYLVTERYETAIEMFTQAESVFRYLSDGYYLGFVYLNLGITQRYLNNHEQSEQFLLTAIQYWKQIGSMTELVNAMDELGLTYVSAHTTSKAIEMFEDAFQVLLSNTQMRRYAQLKSQLQSHLQLAKQNLC